MTINVRFILLFIEKLFDLHLALPTVYSLKSMPCSGLTGDDVSTPPSLEPLPAHLTSTQKAPPGVVPSPLDALFLCHDNAEWEAKNFIVTYFPDADSTVAMKVNLFDFVKETPDKFLNQKFELDTRLYLVDYGKSVSLTDPN